MLKFGGIELLSELKDLKNELDFIYESDDELILLTNDSGKDDKEISSEQFNEEFMIFNIHWSGDYVNVRQSN